MRADPPAPPLSEGAKNRAKWASSPARACACARLASMAACMRTCTYQPQMAMGWCHWATRIASRPIGPSQVRGSQGPSHMGLLPGSCLACARLASMAACMRTCTDPPLLGGAIMQFAMRTGLPATRMCDIQKPSHMGLLPGSCLACARLASKAACMHICTFSAYAGSSLTSVSRIAGFQGEAAISSLTHHSIRRRAVQLPTWFSPCNARKTVND